MYIDRSIIARDPFCCIDALGVGQLVERAVQAFSTNSEHRKINVVGKHCSDPISIRYFDQLGVDELTVLETKKVPSVIIASAQSRIEPFKSEFNSMVYIFKWSNNNNMVSAIGSQLLSGLAVDNRRNSCNPSLFVFNLFDCRSDITVRTPWKATQTFSAVKENNNKL